MLGREEQRVLRDKQTRTMAKVCAGLLVDVVGSDVGELMLVCPEYAGRC